MKKFLMIAAATAALSSSAYADIENMFYIKVNGGAQILNKTSDKATGLKMKSQTNPFMGFGVGYYVMDNMRTDLTIEHFFNPTLKKGGKDSEGADGTVKHKGDINSLMLNGYVDLFDGGMAKFFAGAGAGISQVKEKITYAYTPAYAPNAVSSKKVNNFTYQFLAGASAELSPGLSAEITYSWKDFGKTKGNTTWEQEVSKTAYKGHHVSAGIRFEM